MNYVERHFGDWARDTAHLSMLEDGAYNRLVDLYYVREQPLPTDLAACCRLARAATKADRDAVKAVLQEFFTLTDDGWRHKRCDVEIERYQLGEPEREVKKANEDNRMRRHREERAQLFKALTDAGQHAAWNIQIAELRTLVQRLHATQPATEAVTRPATAPATPATATHSPLPTPHSPDTTSQEPIPKLAALAARAPPPNPETAGKPEKPPPTAEDPEGGRPGIEQGPPTAYGAISRRLREAGVHDAQPHHPLFRTLVDAGATVEEFLPYVAKATDGSIAKPFAYVVAAVEGERKRALTTAKGIHRGPLPAAETAWQRSQRERVAEMTGGLASRKPPQAPTATQPAEVIDATSRLVG